MQCTRLLTPLGLESLVSSQSQLCLHPACFSKKVTLKIVQLLHNTLPGSLWLRNDDGGFPIHNLCHNEDLDDTNSLDILQFMLEIDPNLSREVNGNGCLPVRYAIHYKSTAFCKELIAAYPQSLQVGDGLLPFHSACHYGKRDDTVDTIHYMLESRILN